MTRPAHPDAGRMDSVHGDEDKTGPTVRDLHGEADRTLATLDDEVDRLTAERDALAIALRLIADGDTMRARGVEWTHGDTVANYQRIAGAALAKLEESWN